MHSVAILGAGFGGLSAAHKLIAHGAKVTIFDKGYYPGGRIASRRIHNPPLHIDYGAQYFTAHHPLFKTFTQQWHTQDLVSPWNPRLMIFHEDGTHDMAPDHAHTRWVGTPHMNRVAEYLAKKLTILNLHRVTALAIEPTSNTFSVTTATHEASPRQEHKGFDSVIINMPAPQAADILDTLAFTSPLTHLAKQSPMLPCWTATYMFHPNFTPSFDAAFVNIKNSPISWVANNASKPQRSHKYASWTVHSTPSWASEHLEKTPKDIDPVLFDAFSKLFPDQLPDPLFRRAHRWRYARPDSDAQVPPTETIDPSHSIVICGDWLMGGRVEGAFLSGLRAAQLLVNRHQLRAVHRTPPFIWEEDPDDSKYSRE